MRDFTAVEAVLRREKPDFVQIDYSLDNRVAEKRMLPAGGRGQNRGAYRAAIRPGAVVPRGAGKEIPDWADEFADSWAQFFLKYLLGDPRVTAVIPGTSDAAHMMDNLGAMHGLLPDPDQRKRMVDFAATL